MRQPERLNAIVEKLSGDGSVSVAAVARQLGVSTATIRRDLHHLEQHRLVARTHGGAVSQGAFYELPLHYRADSHKDEKRRIAAAAAELVTDGASVGLTGGTTTTEVARALVGRRDLTVVTNALNIASELALRPSVKLVVTGGVVRSASYELVGPFAEATLARIYLDIVFIGVDGISLESGVTTHHEVEAHINRALIDRARRALIVADRSKFGKVAFAQICDLSHVEGVITDSKADAAAVEALREAGLQVLPV